MCKELFETHNPDLIVIEDTQMQQNVKSFAMLCQLIGVIFSLCFEKTITFSLCPSSSWRSICGIKGKNRPQQKEAAIQWAIEKYNINPETDDEAEAIALAYSYIIMIGDK